MTTEEIAKYKEWAESIGITVRSYADDKRPFHVTKGGPSMLRSCMGDTIDELWVEFAFHAKPLFEAVAAARENAALRERVKELELELDRERNSLRE